ncbi:MAG: aldolase/citrate lyase family protein [Spirochaetaceae bacterium]|nr:aldolase/citrate lyase family protein [Spirochaetaceae bacterium]
MPSYHNPVKKKLQEGKPSFGSWIQIPHPAVAEMLSEIGFDWIAVDMEHSDAGAAAYSDIIRGMYGRGPVPMARVQENDTLVIRRLLDAGAWGVIVPMVNSGEEAEAAVRAVRFPPRGIRGAGFARANDYGVGFTDYLSASEDILVMAMCETRQSVENIEEIVAVDGIDGIFMGPFDLSMSYGIPGKTNDPLVVQARQKVLAACKKAGKAPGLHHFNMTRESIQGILGEGFLFVALGVDASFLQGGAQAAFAAATEK